VVGLFLSIDGAEA